MRLGDRRQAGRRITAWVAWVIGRKSGLTLGAPGFTVAAKRLHRWFASKAKSDSVPAGFFLSPQVNRV
jgi:hypothetical protein